MIKYMVIDIGGNFGWTWVDIVTDDCPDIQMAEAVRLSYLKETPTAHADNVQVIQYKE